MTHYDILEVAPHSSPDVIKNAYRALAKKYHPDLQPNENAKQSAESIFKTLTEAYEVLSDTKRRKVYDLWLNVNNSQEEAVPPVTTVRETKTSKATILNKIGKVVLSAVLLIGIIAFVSFVVNYNAGLDKIVQVFLIVLSSSGIIAFILLIVSNNNAILKKVLKALLIALISIALIIPLYASINQQTPDESAIAYYKNLEILNISIEKAATGNEIVGRVRNNSTSMSYPSFAIKCNVYDKDNSILQTVEIINITTVPPGDVVKVKYTGRQIDPLAVSVKPLKIGN